MAEQLYFARHTKVYLQQGANIWEIPVMDGFSFSQATNASEVTLQEMESTGGISRRGRTMFNDSLAPAEWSFSTYVRPFISETGGDLEGDVAFMHAVEEPLWANFVNNWDSTDTYVPGVTTTPGVWGDGVTEGVVIGAGSTEFNFDASNSSTLGTFDLLFDLGSCSGGTPEIYKIEGCVVGAVTIDFDIDGIAMANWSGFGALISDTGTTATIPTIVEGTSATSNFIRNRLTTLAIQAGDDDAQGGTPTGAGFTVFPGAATNGVYNVVLTGGSISFENNITFLTPETLCRINVPIGHVTGNRTIGGSFTAYLDTGDAGATGDLWEDVLNAGVTHGVVTNKMQLLFTVGGASAPKVAFDFPQCHVEVPTHSIEDVISLEVTFAALPSTIVGTDEATITYTGVAL